MAQIRRGGRPAFAGKVKKAFGLVLALPFYALAVPAVIVIRLIRPWFLIRLGFPNVGCFGHFAIDMELYACERDAGINRPMRRHVDFLYMPESPCNQQLAVMWRRAFLFWPSWMLAPLCRVDRLIPGEKIPGCGESVQGDRDVHNLLDRFPPHLEFTPEEEARGEAGLRGMGIPRGKPFVCLNVRDSAWNAFFNQTESYENEQSYRNTDVQNYILAAEALADRGYVVVRMGAIVREEIRTAHPGVIDYATNGMRSDFMDIYLGAKCSFCVSTGSGFDAVPMIFRRPVAFVNFVPLVHLHTFSAKILAITQRCQLAGNGHELSLREIFARGAWLVESRSDDLASGIRLVENTPEEIRDLALEMAERLEGTWKPQVEDEDLQKRFWRLFPRNAPGFDRGRRWHGEIRARFGAAFLRANRAWLDR